MCIKQLILSLIALATAAAGQRPSILFIAIDDLRPEFGCYGATQVKTPQREAHITYLASLTPALATEPPPPPKMRIEGGRKRDVPTRHNRRARDAS